jgi:hypothetical protein
MITVRKGQEIQTNAGTLASLHKYETSMTSSVRRVSSQAYHYAACIHDNIKNIHKQSTKLTCLNG